MNVKVWSVLGAALLAVPTAANAQLSLVDGGLGVYDSKNDVTWTSDADLFAKQAASYKGGAAALVSAVIADSDGVIHDTPNPFDTVPDSGTYSLSASDFNTRYGGMTWWAAQAWVTYLDATDYGGSNRWALPTTVDPPTPGHYVDPSLSSSQLAELFYGDLGQIAGRDISFTHNANYSLFSDIRDPGAYWSGTQSSQDTESAWNIYTDEGFLAPGAKFGQDLVLAVSPGEVTSAPEIDPASAASGLALLVGGLVMLSGHNHRGRRNP